jgi:hypothetical protein
VDVKPFERTSWFFQTPERWKTTLVPLAVYKGTLSGPVELTLEVRPGVTGGEFTKAPEPGEHIVFLRKSGEGWTLVEPRTQALRSVTPELLKELGAPSPSPQP